MSPLENDANNTQQAIGTVQGRMLRRLYQAWECTQVSRRGAYTARRTHALERYCHTASVTRVLAVCLLTPVPILGFVVAMEMLPLNPPSDGWRRNSGWILRYVFVFTLLTLSCLQQASSFLTTLNVTLGQALAITWICVSCYFIVLLAIMDVWVFPVPFVFELTGGVFGVVFVVCVVVVFGSQTLTRTPKFSTQMRVVYSISAVEGAMCLVYPAFSAAFHVLHGGWQLAFILLLYFLKVLMRFLMVLACCSSKDMEDKVRLQSRLPELVAFSTEIFHLVYLMTCLQGPHIPVWAATTLVLIDVLTSAFSVHRIIRRPAMTLILGPPKRSSVPGRRSLSAVVPVSGPPASALPPSPSGISDTVSSKLDRIRN
ncbi:hypothetical protein PF005_g10386 [Phytophthora fragariae]|uniref:Uncharacterized protein n=1 Tax=Phytophthora fragariae TaxID=53985 RepID=A0A6A3L806_9STRA|nr:hypothetical protein PF009_g11549 [Phytophthora fragariae]KAE9011913.1 hypothetical protein PF011_g9161 [Phytophthora fragariae]KAE9113602.1 hypothetical protein PF007_g10686 [Phytophthora fragariae]KAE9114108.1 hypothetical protein PF010_g9823 [Phytophthora fragariae]KAE9145354.1 hypothetical protein PF006_g9787 [Phytophthora fragariae]